MKLSIAPGWSADVERGPDWLFVKLHSIEPVSKDGFSACDLIWQMLEQGFTHRLVLEMDDLPVLASPMVGELVQLHQKICSRGGVMRLAGLSDRNYSVLELSRLNSRFPQFRTREEAVMGCRPKQPR